MSYECGICGHASSAHVIGRSGVHGEDECCEHCTIEGCGCGQYVGPKDSDSAGEREPIAEADGAETFAQNCAKRRAEQ